MFSILFIYFCSIDCATTFQNTMKRNKIIVIGSSNTDMTVKTSRLPGPGETVMGGTFSMGGGGKGANQAVAVSRLGGNAEFVCKVGDDIFGRASVQRYREEGIITSHVMTSPQPSGVALIYVDDHAENCIAVAPGANYDLKPEDISSIGQSISEAAIMLLQLEIPLETVVAAAMAAREADVKVVLNPAPAQALPDGLYRDTYLIIPNETEAQALTGVQIDSPESAAEAARILQVKGAANVIITMGAKGSSVTDSGGRTEFIPAVRVQAKDTTAAGDTFCGAVCVALADGKSLTEAAGFATRASALSVQRIGAQQSIPYIREL